MDIKTDYMLDTLLHMSEVRENLEVVSSRLKQRGEQHDRSKFQEPEFSVFTSTREKFKDVKYGTPEYQERVNEAKVAVDHHHANNRHHTSFHKNGVNDMSLIDIMEMLADWKAAERRSSGQPLVNTLDYAYKKYGIDSQLGMVITNTLRDLGWI